jgi:glycosyltransferase involved in cell wall biosynthesis
VADGKGDQERAGVKIHDVGRPAGRLNRMIGVVLRIHRRANALNSAIYHFHDPELFFVGIMLTLRGRKVIFDIHEDYPKDIFSKRWIPFLLRFPVSWAMAVLNWVAAKVFAALIIAWPDINRPYMKHKVTLVGNYPILGDLPEGEPYLERPHELVMAGEISVMRSAREIIAACGQVSGCKNFKLVVAGKVDEVVFENEFLELIRSHPIEYQGWIPLTQAYELIAQSRGGLALYYPEPNHLNSEPTKLYEYMAAGVPVITSNFKKYRELVETLKCGIVVDPTDSGAIAKAIMWILDNPEKAQAMGCRGQKAVEECFHWELEERKLVNLYGELASGSI